MDLFTLSCIAAFSPLVGAILAGFLGWKLGRAFAHTVTIASVAISFAASFMALLQVRVKARDRMQVLKMPPTMAAPPAPPEAAVENKA